MVVSASKTPEDAMDVAGSVAVVTGEELRRTGARTLQDALQNVVGVEAAGGSDGGPRFPNLGMWGLKEFDALLVTVDGVPAGGPFNPSLAQIPIEDIDRIEIVKGPQGTLYGVSAFAGMVQVFTRRGKNTSVNLGLGSWNDKHGSISLEQHEGNGILRLAGSMFRDNGFQDGTGSSVDRLVPRLRPEESRQRVGPHARRPARHGALGLAPPGRGRGARARLRGGPQLRGGRRAHGPPRLLAHVHRLPDALPDRAGREHARPRAGRADRGALLHRRRGREHGHRERVVPAPRPDDAVRGRAGRLDARHAPSRDGDRVHVRARRRPTGPASTSRSRPDRTRSSRPSTRCPSGTRARPRTAGRSGASTRTTRGRRGSGSPSRSARGTTGRPRRSRPS